ncbi:MAG: segregation/condensation protein A [Patescibacteria group bacterium]
MHESYKIKIPAFEGPLELLVDLIEKRKLAINDISLARVTDDFIAYIKSLGSLPIAYTAHFIITAATLVLIKSKSLLPNFLLTQDEEGNIDELKRRLEMYALFREVGEKLKNIFAGAVLFKRPYPKIEPMFVPDKSLTVSRLALVLREAIKNIPVVEKTPETTIAKAITLEEMIDNLTKRITESMTLSFKQFSKEVGHKTKEERVFVIVGFLAILELVKQGIVLVRQESQFDDIHIERNNTIIPQK